MANTNASTSTITSDSSEQRVFLESNVQMAQPPMIQQSRSSLDGPIAILWDIENCRVPSDVRPEDVAGNIRMTLRVHPVINGAVVTFAAYGDFNAFPRRLREGCQRTGIRLTDVPNGRKDAADKAILVDMFLFALDNPPPSSIMLISGDVDFAPALHVLGQRGYTIILVIPFGVGVSSALCNAGKFVWDWQSVVRGDGFVPPAKFLPPSHGGQADIAAYLMGCQINDNVYGQTEEEAIVYRGTSQNFYSLRDFTMVSQSQTDYNCSTSISMPCFPTSSRSKSLPSGLNEVSAGPSSYDEDPSAIWVQPGDVNGLKAQLVKLLELSGGCLPLTRVHAEYQKMYGRPLYMSEYGVCKLVHLFKKMGDSMAIDGKGQKKFVYLRNWRASPSAAPLSLEKKDKKGKGSQEENTYMTTAVGSSDEFSEEERAVIEEQEKRSIGKSSPVRTSTFEMKQNLEQFKQELQDILVSYSCRIFLGCFEAIYHQRYKRTLEYQRFGVDQLDELLYMVRDVIIVDEDPVSRRKFLTVIGG